MLLMIAPKVRIPIPVRLVAARPVVYDLRGRPSTPNSGVNPRVPLSRTLFHDAIVKVMHTD